MENITYFLKELDSFSTIRIDLSTRDPQEIAEVIAFFEENKDKYGCLNTEFSRYGRLYLDAPLREQRRAFLNDVFSPQKGLLSKISDIDYERDDCHIPEEISCRCSSSQQAYY